MTDVPDWIGRPYQPVHNAPASSSQWENLTQDQLKVLRQRLIESIIQIVVQAFTGFFLPGGGVGNAFSQLEEWVEALLGAFGGAGGVGQVDTFIGSILNLLGNPLGLLTGSPVLGDLSTIPLLGYLQTAVDYIWDAFDTGILGTSSDNPLESVFEAVFKIFGTGTNAQSVNVIQDSRLDALAGGGSGLSDAFDGAASSALNSTKWAQIYGGPGSGTCGLSGDGFCVWNTSGSSERASQNVYKTVTTTDTQSVAISIGANLSNASGVDPTIQIIGRSNLAGTNYIVAVINYNSVQIGYVLSDSYTRLGAITTLTDATTSGTWQLKLGTATSSREFVLLRNGATVISRTDSGAASALDSSHRYSGFTMGAGWEFSIFFGFPVQVAPPPVGAWAASDITP